MVLRARAEAKGQCVLEIEIAGNKGRRTGDEFVVDEHAEFGLVANKRDLMPASTEVVIKRDISTGLDGNHASDLGVRPGRGVAVTRTGTGKQATLKDRHARHTIPGADVLLVESVVVHQAGNPRPVAV